MITILYLIKNGDITPIDVVFGVMTDMLLVLGIVLMFGGN